MQSVSYVALRRSTRLLEGFVAKIAELVAASAGTQASDVEIELSEGSVRATCSISTSESGATSADAIAERLEEPERVKALARSIAEGVTALPNIETAATGTISAEVGGPEVVDIPEEDASGVKDVAAPTKSLSVLAVVLLGGALRMEIRA